MTETKHRAEYDPPNAKGPVVWYVTNNEVLEIRMQDTLWGGCIRAANLLSARFFITRRPRSAGTPAGWHVFDTRRLDPGTTYTPIALENGKKLRARKVFDLSNFDGAVMWAIVMEGIR